MTEFVDNLAIISAEQDAAANHESMVVKENLAQLEEWRRRQLHITTELAVLHEAARGPDQSSYSSVVVPVVGMDGTNLSFLRASESFSSPRSASEARLSFYVIKFGDNRSPLQTFRIPDVILGSSSAPNVYTYAEEIFGAEELAKLFVLFKWDNKEGFGTQEFWNQFAPRKMGQLRDIESRSFIAQRQYAVDRHQAQAETILEVVRESVIHHLATQIDPAKVANPDHSRN